MATDLSALWGVLVVVSLLSCSLPSMKVTPARTRAVSSAPVISGQRAWAEPSSC
jgi:hypothetical protein